MAQTVVVEDESLAKQDGTHRYDFFEVVEVHGEPGFPAREGVIVGKAPVEDETAGRWYAVSPARGETHMVEEQDMRRTGLRVPRESIYDGSRVRVSQQGDSLGIDLDDQAQA